MSTLEDIELEHDVWRKVLVIIIVAIVILMVFVFTPLLIDIIMGNENQESPSEQLHGTFPLILLLL